MSKAHTAYAAIKGPKLLTNVNKLKRETNGLIYVHKKNDENTYVTHQPLGTGTCKQNVSGTG